MLQEYVLAANGLPQQKLMESPLNFEVVLDEHEKEWDGLRELPVTVL